MHKVIIPYIYRICNQYNNNNIHYTKVGKNIGKNFSFTYTIIKCFFLFSLKKYITSIKIQHKGCQLQSLNTSIAARLPIDSCPVSQYWILYSTREDTSPFPETIATCYSTSWDQITLLFLCTGKYPFHAKKRQGKQGSLVKKPT